MSDPHSVVQSFLLPRIELAWPRNYLDWIASGDEGSGRIDCGENCVGPKGKQVVIGGWSCKSDRLRSAVNVSECSYNVTGALLGCRFRDREVGGSNPLAPTILKSNATITYGCQHWRPYFLVVANLWAEKFDTVDIKRL